jgi:hypothetical protein
LARRGEKMPISRPAQQRNTPPAQSATAMTTNNQRMTCTSTSSPGDTGARTAGFRFFYATLARNITEPAVSASVLSG